MVTCLLLAFSVGLGCSGDAREGPAGQGSRVTLPPALSDCELAQTLIPELGPMEPSGFLSQPEGERGVKEPPGQLFPRTVP